MWKTLKRQVLLDRTPWLRVLADDVELPDGRRVEGYLRLETNDHVVVVPVTDDQRLVLLRSYKRGPDAVDLQPPAGMIEREEEPARAAERELLEETGYSASAWTWLGRSVLGGNLGAGWANMFLATGCQPVAAPNPGDLEEQEVVLMPLEEARRQWREGGFLQLGSVAALGLAFDRLAARS
ncbi:MAG TPA: NUDIX hydrolase [Anaerolineales bacterium]|nr:NUDIX hydrolase [Anaerolineales bacterium]